MADLKENSNESETTLVNHKKKEAPRKAGRMSAAVKQALTNYTGDRTRPQSV